MPQRSLTVHVECHSGYRADERPRRFHIGERTVEVVEVIDRWLAPGRRYFKLRGDDGGIYILCHDEAGGWEMTLYDSGRHPPTRLSST
ncbi:hypothetical protein [Arhodomonas sp. AD133]|uniref:hypothetical protein n=1 Tax=Arhodomonas sp. AD133 TaxID=3415009 RepID=UPI003EBF6B70